jgi:drug/metabolite transporter (DMT)-like permease
MTVTVMTHDTAVSRTGAGLLLAIASATSFGMSGALARGLLDTGWTAGAAVGVRTAIAAVVLLVPGALALRGRWYLLRDNAGLVTVYGVSAVAGAQLCYFYAVTYMQVSVALLLEYTAPVAVVIWLWLRHGHRPSALTVLGAAIAAAGLVLVLDVVSGAELSTVGVLWALGAMVGAATYFVISADESNGLPGISLAAGGLLVGGTVLLTAGAVGVLPFRTSTADAVYDGVTVAWWIPVLALGLVTAALAYVTGIAAGRRLGSRLASFVALGEVLAAVVFAWLLLGELPRAIQLAGGLLVLAGVVVVKLGEGRSADGSASVLSLEEHLAVQEQERRRDRDREQGAEDAHERATHQSGDDGDRARQVDGPLHDPGVDHVGLELLVGEVVDQRDQRHGR